MVYQFSLPPLLLEAVLGQDVSTFRQWLAGLQAAPPGTEEINLAAFESGYSYQ